MLSLRRLQYPFTNRIHIPTDLVLYGLLVPFLSTCKTLGIGKNNMKHHTPWVNLNYPICSRYTDWSDIFLYLHLNEGWQLSDFSNYLGREGTIKACVQFPQLVEGRLIHLLVDSSSLIGLQTRILGLFPRLF